MTRTIWVKVPPHNDPALAGKARVRKPWAPNRWFTEEPTEVEHTSSIARMILRGDLVQCKPPSAAPKTKAKTEPEQGPSRSDR